MNQYAACLKPKPKLHRKTKFLYQSQYVTCLVWTPGSAVEWLQDGSNIIVKRAARSTSKDVHAALFGDDDTPKPAKTLAELKQGIAEHTQRRHARR